VNKKVKLLKDEKRDNKEKPLRIQISAHVWIKIFNQGNNSYCVPI